MGIRDQTSTHGYEVMAGFQQQGGMTVSLFKGHSECSVEALGDEWNRMGEREPLLGTVVQGNEGGKSTGCVGLGSGDSH
jgi:hypothetical protein